MTDYPMPTTPPPFVLLRDGKFLGGVRFDNLDGAFADLLRRQGQSVSYALNHGGYSVVSVPTERWSEQEARWYQAIATNVFYEDEAHNAGHDQADDLTRANCAACRLRGYQSPHDEASTEIEPNHASWARTYVESHTPIPQRWRAAFERERVSDNLAYAAALNRSITTFGVTFI